MFLRPLLLFLYRKIQPDQSVMLQRFKVLLCNDGILSALFPGDLEGKVKWLDNYQKVKQLRDALVWLPVWERDKRAFVPEVRLLTHVSTYTGAKLTPVAGSDTGMFNNLSFSHFDTVRLDSNV